MRRLLCIAVVASLWGASPTAVATTIHVPDDEPTIQAGIDAASVGDTVLVECGTYYEHDIELKSGLYLTSETGLADCVTIDAQQLGRVFYCYEVDATASIAGLTITGGLATGSSPDDRGGGMYCHYSSPTLTNCTFSGNQTPYGRGGGMHCYYSSPTLTDCTFSGNQAGSGGGMRCHHSSPTLTDCTFSGNQATYVGGGMCCYYSSLTLTDCTFSGNQASSGGGMSCGYPSSPTLTDCTFSGNQAHHDGGGMFCGNSSPTLTDCTFSGNEAAYYGGGVYCEYYSSLTLSACIIAFSQLGEAIYCNTATSIAVLSCCDVYGNAGGDWVGCIADQYGINGNICEDPLFCGDLNPGEPYTLHSDSPCAPDHNPECGLIGAWGVGCGSTAVEETSWGSIKAMFK